MSGAPIRIGASLFGLAFATMAIFVLLAVFGYFPADQTFTLSTKVTTVFGGMTFVCAGLGMILFGIGVKRLAAGAGGLSLLFFLLTFNWISFGPGERNFTRKTQSSLTATTVKPVSEIEGRLVFGAVTGFVDLLIIYAIMKARREKS